MTQQARYSAAKRKPKPATLALIVLLHILAVYGLARAFAPDFTQSMEREVLTTFNVDLAEPPASPPPPAPPTPDEGAQGDPGRMAVASPDSAPEVVIPLRQAKPRPKTASTGTASTSGATTFGAGTGAAGQGSGTGSGSGGTGTGNGNIPATKPSVASGELDTASDFPVPPGGRRTRFGKSVTVAFTVGTDGRARNCSVIRSGVDAATTALVCDLVSRKIRFNPATTRGGTPIEARYGYRVDFTAAR